MHTGSEFNRGSLNESLAKLERFGGFDVVETLIAESKDLNPDDKSTRMIFLVDYTKRAERKTLKIKLRLWIGLLMHVEDNRDIDLVSTCELQKSMLQINTKHNTRRILEGIRHLEVTYRCVSMFFRNAGLNTIRNIAFLNASIDQLTDLDEPRFIDYAKWEMSMNYDKLDLAMSYSLLVIPGFLRSHKVVERWAKIAFENKALLVTDFEDCESPEDTLDVFTDANLASMDRYKTNVIMTCNYLLARRKVPSVEVDDLVVPASASLAGKMYGNLPSVMNTFENQNFLRGAEAVRFDVKRSQLRLMEKAGLVPMMNDHGKVFAFSARTLYVGKDPGLQIYSVVGVFDAISKFVITILNGLAFEIWTTLTAQNIRKEIIRFLDSIQGRGKLIERYKLYRCECNSEKMVRVYVEIHVVPFYPDELFAIKLTGHKEADSHEWSTEYNHLV